MKKRYKQLAELIKFSQPKTIIEVGVNMGNSAEFMCREALRYRKEVNYIGYDLFEDATQESNASENNGKPATSEEFVRKRLSKIKGLTFDLVRGNTKTTLHGTDTWADFVFIDGGHSVETIRGDYEAVKGSPLIVFDDYYTSGADTSKIGCNQIVEGLPHEILPQEDAAGSFLIKMAVVGYSSKWAAAFERIRKKDGIKEIAIWREGFNRKTEMIAAINSLEPLIDPSIALEQIRAQCKRLFFVLKADAIRSLDWWRSELEKRFQITEWFGDTNEIHGPTSEVCGTASPLFLVGEWNSKGVMAEDDRFEHTKINCLKVKKRLPPPPKDLRDTKAIIVCYGPSLNDTWPTLLSEMKFDGGDLFSVSGAHDYLARRDVVPKYHVECDPREHKVKNLTRMHQDTEYLIASCCHPNLVEHLLPYNLTLWHMCNGQESLRTIDELEPDQFMVHGGGNAGLRAIAVAYVMGYRQFTIYGMDCSYKDDKQWAGPHAGKLKDVIEVVCEGKKYKTSPVLVTYARHFLETMDNAPGAQFTIVGDGLLYAMLRAGQNKEKAA